MAFEADIFYGHLIQGNLTKAISYLREFPGEAARLERYMRIFAQEEYICYPIADALNAALRFYQMYFRAVFYLNVSPREAELELLHHLARHFSLQKSQISIDEVEEKEIAPCFEQYGLHFMGGKTAGYYGPYVWKDTERRSYLVELPEGVQPYDVYFHRGFIFNSWLHYISLGEIGAGGWTDKEGVIHCIADSYDENSENFQVSLLKHEAQHARDLQAYPNMNFYNENYILAASLGLYSTMGRRAGAAAAQDALAK